MDVAAPLAALLRRCAADRGRCRARRDAAVLPPGPVRDLRSAAAQRAPRRHDGDRRQGRADHRRDQVSRADLVGDCKWTDYLDFCDRFFWAVPQALERIAEARMLSSRARRTDRRRSLRRRGDPRGGRIRRSPRRGARRNCCASPDAPRGGCRRRSTRLLAWAISVIDGYLIEGPTTALLVGFDASRSISAIRSSGDPAWHNRARCNPPHDRPCRDRRRLRSNWRTSCAAGAAGPRRSAAFRQACWRIDLGARASRYARAFVIADARSDDQRRVAVLVADIGIGALASM